MAETSASNDSSPAAPLPSAVRKTALLASWHREMLVTLSEIPITPENAVSIAALYKNLCDLPYLLGAAPSAPPPPPPPSAKRPRTEDTTTDFPAPVVQARPYLPPLTPDVPYAVRASRVDLYRLGYRPWASDADRHAALKAAKNKMTKERLLDNLQAYSYDLPRLSDNIVKDMADII
jgi:hypothetical protein